MKTFKQHFNESVLDELGKTKSVRYMTEDELIKIGMEFESESFAEDLDFNKGWCITSKLDDRERFIIPFLPRKGDRDNLLGISFYKSVPFYTQYNYGGSVGKDSVNGKYIEHFEREQKYLKAGLSKDQATTAIKI